MAFPPRIPCPRAALVVASVFVVLGIVTVFEPDNSPEETRSFPLWVLGGALILFAGWLFYITRIELQRRRSESPDGDASS